MRVVFPVGDLPAASYTSAQLCYASERQTQAVGLPSVHPAFRTQDFKHPNPPATAARALGLPIQTEADFRL